MNRAILKSAIVFSFFMTASYAQGPDSLHRSVDSLKRLLADTHGAARYELAFKIAYDLFDVDNPQAVQYAEEAFDLAKDIGDTATIVRSGRIYGQLLWRVGELNESIQLMERLILIAERCGYQKDFRFLANSLGIACTMRGQYDKALQYSFKSLELRENRGDKVEIAIAQNVVGTAFYTMGIYDRAAEFLTMSLETDSLHEYVPDLKVTLALCYAHLSYLDESKFLLQAVIDQYGVRIRHHTLARISYGLGLVDWRRGDHRQAQAHFQKGYELAKTDFDKSLMSDCLAKLGDIYMSNQDLAKGETVLLESESLADEIGYRNGTEAANMLLARLYSTKKDYVNASIAKSKVIALRDSSISQGVIDNIFRHQFDYYERQHTQTIATQAELLSLKERTITYHLILNVVSLACATLLISVIALLYRSNRLKKQIAIDLEKRVRQRTSDLKVFDDSLRRARLEKKFTLDGIARRLNASLATFKGLSVVAVTYEKIPTEFAKNLDTASDSLTLLLQQIEYGKKQSEH